MEATKQATVTRRRMVAAVLVVSVFSTGLVAILSRSAMANYKCTRGGHDCSLHWHGHHIHWHFTNAIVGKREAVRLGAQRWQNTNSEFYFVEDGAAPSHIWQHALPCPGACVIVAETHLTSVSGDHLLERDMHFNSNLNFNNNVDACPNGQNYDTLGIGMHEWGHMFALGENNVSYFPRPTMEQGGFPKCWARTLEESDKDGQRAIYDLSPGD